MLTLIDFSMYYSKINKFPQRAWLSPNKKCFLSSGQKPFDLKSGFQDKLVTGHPCILYFDNLNFFSSSISVVQSNGQCMQSFLWDSRGVNVICLLSVLQTFFSLRWIKLQFFILPSRSYHVSMA